MTTPTDLRLLGLAPGCFAGGPSVHDRRARAAAVDITATETDR